jgi:hypothetical protein
MTIQTNFDFYICIVDDHTGDQQHLVDAEQQDPVHNFDLLAENDFLLDDDSSTSSDCYSDDSSLESFEESEDDEGSGMDDDDDGSLGTNSLLISRCRRRRNRTEQTDHMGVFSSLRGTRESDENGMFEEDSVKLTRKTIPTNTRGRQRHHNRENAIPTELIISLKD